MKRRLYAFVATVSMHLSRCASRGGIRYGAGIRYSNAPEPM